MGYGDPEVGLDIVESAGGPCGLEGVSAGKAELISKVLIGFLDVRFRKYHSK